MNQIFMKRAIELAKNGLGFTSPNPCVGAVIVKGDQIVSEGWHKRSGDLHAEIVAIKDIMKKSGIRTVDIDPTLFQNATLYVTLEPCCHYGKTPPCLDVILAASFKKICIGMIDPFSKVAGKSIKALKQHGVEVEICKQETPLFNEICALNQPFIKWAVSGLPYVIMKSGLSLDGKIATSSGESKWITSEKARNDAKLQRSLCDAVLVGYNTILKDDPEMAAVGKYKSKKLLRIVIDEKLTLSLDHKIFRDENVFVACTSLASVKNKKKFKKAGVEFRSFGKEKVSVKKLLEYLAGKNIQSVFIEGGSGVNGLFYDAALRDCRLLDKVIFYVAPKIIGGESSLSVIGGEGVKRIKNCVKFKSFDVEKAGEDLKVSGIVNFY